LGLTFEGELVQCMSLRTPRHNRYRRSKLIEVARTCTKLNTFVRGGLSRLTKHALHHAGARNSIGLMTYVDMRLGGDMPDQNAGWQFVERTKRPRFWWTDNLYRYDRFKFRADRERGLTEREVADEAGVVRIYGCKNAIYTYM